MAQLDANWITQGRIDFEYKKYLLLAYLQKVDSHFNNKELYPFLSDLVFHYHNLVSLKKNKTITINQFPKRLSKIEFENFKLEYERIIHEDEFMEEIDQITDFALPKIKDYLSEGRGIFDRVENALEVQPIGIVPLQPMTGYLFLRAKTQRVAKVYEYAVTIFENAKEKYRGLKTHYVDTYNISISNTFEMIKVDLIKNYKQLPNPGTYLIESEMPLPFTETFFPIAKRILVKKISENNPT